METNKIFLTEAYQKSSSAKIIDIGPNGGVVLDQTLFYATSGGQPNDLGQITIKGQAKEVKDVRKLGKEGIEIIVEIDKGCVGEHVTQEINWDRRYKLMKIHTALHLLSVVIPLPVTGGSMSEEKGRLDFAMPEPLDNKAQIQDQLNAIINQNYQVSDEWISSEELKRNMNLVKTMSVMPPMDSGKVRLIRIHNSDRTVDLQPCGGTHVASTGEIGAVRLGKVENKGRNNRRVNLFLD